MTSVWWMGYLDWDRIISWKLRFGCYRFCSIRSRCYAWWGGSSRGVIVRGVRVGRDRFWRFRCRRRCRPSCSGDDGEWGVGRLRWLRILRVWWGGFGSWLICIIHVQKIDKNILVLVFLAIWLIEWHFVWRSTIARQTLIKLNLIYLVKSYTFI